MIEIGLPRNLSSQNVFWKCVGKIVPGVPCEMNQIHGPRSMFDSLSATPERVLNSIDR